MPVETGPDTSPGRVYAYRNPEKNLGTIRLMVFYVVPKDRKDRISADWREAAEEALGQIKRFHALQFQNASVIDYSLFPEPIVLESNGVLYDTTSTEAGNPKALVSIGEEIERRVMRPDGDLHRSDLAARPTDQYRVLGFLYEGVGASGGIIYDSELGSVEEIAAQLGVPASIIYKVSIDSADGFFLLNRDYLVKSEYAAYGSTLLYHEFAHTLGVPDQYDHERSLSNDIMGGGRTQPLSIEYLDRSTLKDMGLFKSQ